MTSVKNKSLRFPHRVCQQNFQIIKSVPVVKTTAKGIKEFQLIDTFGGSLKGVKAIPLRTFNKHIPQ